MILAGFLAKTALKVAATKLVFNAFSRSGSQTSPDINQYDSLDKEFKLAPLTELASHPIPPKDQFLQSMGLGRFKVTDEASRSLYDSVSSDLKQAVEANYQTYESLNSKIDSLYDNIKSLNSNLDAVSDKVSTYGKISTEAAVGSSQPGLLKKLGDMLSESAQTILGGIGNLSQTISDAVTSAIESLFKKKDKDSVNPNYSGDDPGMQKVIEAQEKEATEASEALNEAKEKLDSTVNSDERITLETFKEPIGLAKLHGEIDDSMSPTEAFKIAMDKYGSAQARELYDSLSDEEKADWYKKVEASRGADFSDDPVNRAYSEYKDAESKAKDTEETVASSRSKGRIETFEKYFPEIKEYAQLESEYPYPDYKNPKSVEAYQRRLQIQKDIEDKVSDEMLEDMGIDRKGGGKKIISTYKSDRTAVYGFDPYTSKYLGSKAVENNIKNLDYVQDKLVKGDYKLLKDGKEVDLSKVNFLDILSGHDALGKPKFDSSYSIIDSKSGDVLTKGSDASYSEVQNNFDNLVKLDELELKPEVGEYDKNHLDLYTPIPNEGSVSSPTVTNGGMNSDSEISRGLTKEQEDKLQELISSGVGLALAQAMVAIENNKPESMPSIAMTASPANIDVDGE